MQLDEDITQMRIPLQDEHEQASVALKALARLGISVAVIKFEIIDGHPEALILRVPSGRVIEAICSLQYFGFACVETQAASTPTIPTYRHDTFVGGA